jgi:hypothetical protein
MKKGLKRRVTLQITILKYQSFQNVIGYWYRQIVNYSNVLEVQVNFLNAMNQ